MHSAGYKAKENNFLLVDNSNRAFNKMHCQEKFIE